MKPQVHWRKVPELLASVRERIRIDPLDRPRAGANRRGRRARGANGAAMPISPPASTARVRIARPCGQTWTVSRRPPRRHSDDALPTWSLAGQRRRVLDRIRRTGGPAGFGARILRFPVLGAPVASNAHPMRRRLSLAAAAGPLLVTVGIVQLVRWRPPAGRGSRNRPPTVATSRPVIGPPGGPGAVRRRRAVHARARGSPELLPRHGRSWRSDEMTPRVRPAAIDIR